MSSPSKQEMDKQLKTWIIKNFKRFNPIDNKDSSNYFLTETPKRPSSDSKAILSHLSLYFFFLLLFYYPFGICSAKFITISSCYFKPNLNLEILKPNY